MREHVKSYITAVGLGAQVGNAQIPALLTPDFVDPLGGHNRLLTGDPGRPSKGYPIYEAEHARRCGANEACKKVSQEANYLVLWFKQKYNDADPPSAGNIENRIRKKHREYLNSKPQENNGNT